MTTKSSRNAPDKGILQHIQQPPEILTGNDYREPLGHAASAVLATENIRKIMTKNETFSTTITLDFKPDNQWDVLHFTSNEPGVIRNPSPGWIIQVEAIVDATLRPTDNDPSLTDLPRDIVPAALDQRYGIVYNPIGDKNFYRFVQRDTRPDLTPGNVNPELYEAWAEWRAHHDPR